MGSDRLNDIEMNLNLLRQQQAKLEQKAITASGLDQIKFEQLLELEIKPKIKTYEAEKWQILSNSVQELTISEEEAEIAVAEIVTEVTQLEASPPANYPDALLQVLREIRDSLNKPSEPETPASAKLKSAISLMPPFVNVSYEGEIDLETFFQTHFPTFRKLIKAATKK